MKNKLKKKMLSHLKEDTKEFKEHIKDDKKMVKAIKKSKKGY